MPLIIKTTGFEDYFDRSGGTYIKALIMGQPDVGKTRSASYWPRPIFADTEKGRMSLADRGVQYGEVTSSADMDALLTQLRLECNKPSRRWDTFVVDTIDSYQRILIQERLRERRKESLSGWEDWGWLDSKMQSLIDRMLNLPMNIVCNMHVKDVGKDDATSWGPKLKGDIKDQVAADFDLVGMMETGYEAVDGVRTKIRTIRWHSEPQYPILKDRSGKLPRQTEVEFSNNDYDRLFVYITGGLEALPQSVQVDSIATEDDEVPAPAPPDLEGGPVEGVAAPEPKKAAKKAVPPAKKAAPAATSVPAQEGVADPATEVPTPVTTPEDTDPPVSEPDPPVSDVETPDPTHDEAVDEAVSVLDGTVIEENAEPEEEEAKPHLTVEPDAEVCGSQPDHFVGKADPAPGCGKDLSGEVGDRVNLAILRTKTRLCDECFTKWKTAN